MCAYSLREASDILRKNPVNILIADYDKHDIKGLNLLKKTKKLKPHIELIFLSEKATLSKAIEAMKLGAYDFYEFPVNTKLILAVTSSAGARPCSTSLTLWARYHQRT